MSGTSGWQSLPKGTQLRLAAVAVLKNAQTLAGTSVKDTPTEPLQPADYPCISVFSAETRDTMGAAGGPPIFKVTYLLRVVIDVIAATEERATILSDLLKQQVLDGLLEDPIWPGLCESIASVTEARKYGADGERKIVSHQMDITTAFRDEYSARLTSPLLAGGQPAALRIVAAPLTKIVNTQQLETDAEGHQTLFVVDTAISQGN